MSTLNRRPGTGARKARGAPTADAGKPPFALLSLRDTLALPFNGLTVVSTFSGCGGSCLGFRRAGFKHLWASEFIPAAAETYRANFPCSPLDERDIRQVTATALLREIGLRKGELDVLEGSPPCASFSTAGKQEGGWGQVRKYSDTKQRVDDLFFEYVRLLDGLKPKVFVAENVSGLVKGVAKGYFKRIVAALEAAGYLVEVRLLDAQWLGVPQRRLRLILQGVRADLVMNNKLRPAWPSPLPYRYTLRDVLPGIGKAVHDTSGLFSDGDFTDAPAPAITVGGQAINSYHFKVYDQREEDRVAKGRQLKGAVAREAENVGPGGQSDRYLSLIRPREDDVSPTILAAHGSDCAGVVHPTQARKFSIPELKVICGFPADFVLTGSYEQQWERLGRAVPPPMSYAIAAALRDGPLRIFVTNPPVAR